MRGLYGDREKYKIKIRLLISAGGNIKKMEPVTTTGFPEVDIIVSKFVKGWIFEPIADAAEEDEWREIKVILKVGE
jgi:outer membrane biosynthesis protein TonB